MGLSGWETEVGECLLLLEYHRVPRRWLTLGTGCPLYTKRAVSNLHEHGNLRQQANLGWKPLWPEQVISQLCILIK